MINEARFYLMMDSGQCAAELMAECSLCGAMTRQRLALAWLERSVACSNCEIAMPFDAAVLDKLRQQAGDAQATIDELRRSTAVPMPPFYG